MSPTPPTTPLYVNDEGLNAPISSLLLSMILESLFLAIFFMAYCVGAYIVLRIVDSRDHLRRARNVLLIVETTMFLLAVAHFSLSVLIILKVYPSNTAPPWYTSVGVAKFTIYVTQTLIGDGFMIYRLYIVWNCRWLVPILPAIMLLCNAMLGFSLPWLTVIPTPDFFIMSFLVNISCTVLILWRVLRLSYGTNSGSLVWRVIEGIVQSAALYSIACVSLVVTSLFSPNDGYVTCLNVFPALTGLVFSFIVIRAGLHLKDKETSCTPLASQTVRPQQTRTSLPSSSTPIGRRRLQKPRHFHKIKASLAQVRPNTPYWSYSNNADPFANLSYPARDML